MSVDDKNSSGSDSDAPPEDITNQESRHEALEQRRAERAARQL